MGNRKGKAPPRYDEAFKEGAVKLVTEGGRQTVEVAKELGISIDSLRNWLRSSGIKAGEANRENREARRVRELEAQIREYKRQVAEKDEVIAVLKKSVGILSKP
jgi:transposase